jgi:hypothetical protein
MQEKQQKIQLKPGRVGENPITFDWISLIVLWLV